LRRISFSHERKVVWFASVARFMPVVVVVALAPMGALAQGTGNQSAAKLGAPALAAPARPQPDPGTLFALSDPAGTVLQFSVTGSTTGTIWGDGVYTSDSVLAVAAVHAGMLQPGESGVVTVELVTGLDAYAGMARNGVTSLSYGPWSMGYQFIGVGAVTGSIALPDPGDLSGFRGQDGTTLAFTVTGDANGAIWGDGIYTDDSPLATAAVHAGLLRPGETGLVGVEILPGQDDYAGAERNGVASGRYGSWAGSYRVLPLSSKASSKLSN
jgi:hypothetical protein